MECSFCKKCIKVADGIGNKITQCSSCKSVWKKEGQFWKEFCTACEDYQADCEAGEGDHIKCHVCGRLYQKSKGKWKKIYLI